MYTAFYGLSANPFQMTPDPRFYFESSSHRRAMAYLLFGLEQAEGFITITGNVGTGKTTILEHLLHRLDPKAYVAAKVVSSHLLGDDMVRAVTLALKLPAQGLDKATLLNQIESFLASHFARGLRTLLLVDEAQNIPPAALEELRMLSNFHVGHQAPLQGILMGQPQLRRLLADDNLEQFRQRIVASHHLEPIGEQEIRDYIRYRLRLVGWNDNPQISEEIFTGIFNHTEGIPRRINTFCNRMMLSCFLDGLNRVDMETIRTVAEDLAREVHRNAEGVPADVMRPLVPDAGGSARPGDASLEGRLAQLEETVARHSRTIKIFSTLVEQTLSDGRDHG